MIQCVDTGECVEKYDDYLKTKHWRAKRKAIIDERKGICEKCKKKIVEKGKMHVHHKTYVRIGDELPSDLMLLCEDCHHAIHNKRKKKTTNTKRKGKAKSCQNCKYSQLMRYKGSRTVLYCNIKVCECSEVCGRHKFGEVKRLPKTKKEAKKGAKAKKKQKK